MSIHHCFENYFPDLKQSIMKFIIGIILLSCCGTRITQSTDVHKVNMCCYFPCENEGICMDDEDGLYFCDCTGTGYYGENCTTPMWKTWISNLFRPNKMTLHYLVSGNAWLWSTVNQFYSLRSYIMATILRIRTDIIDTPPLYIGHNEYPTVGNLYNLSYYARTLPPIPHNCPTEMGTKGPVKLPPIKEIAEKIFKREKFKPCPIKSNMLFAAYAQYFSHIFFKTDMRRGAEFTWGNHNVDMCHLYGRDKHAEDLLRLHKDGKMKSQTINGEEFPMFTKDIPVKMLNPFKIERVFAVGHEFYNALPTLSLFATIFLREHNRVAAILKKEHPHWLDERIFQTTKLILLGEILKITVEDYVQHLSNYKIHLLYDPELLHDTKLQYTNRIHAEFNILYRWHPMVPDQVKIGKEGKLEDVTKWVYNGTEIILEQSPKTLLEALVSTRAGRMGAQNHGKATLDVAIKTMEESRELRLQSLNQYRKRFRLEPYKSFIELTDNKELADMLESFYGDIDAVEYYPGLLAEKRLKPSIFGQSLIEMGSPYSLQGIFGNIVSNPRMWRSTTFGGEVGFDIVKNANLKKLMCNNLPGPCPRVSFKTEGENIDQVVEDDVEQDHGEL